MTTDVTTPATGPAGTDDVVDLLARPPGLPGLTPETVVFITGGSGAIGLRTAAVLSRIGARVAIMARSPERVAQAGGDNVPSAGRPDRPTTTGRIPLGRRGMLDDYVGAILFLISGLSAYVTGTDLLVDGGAAILR